MAKVVEVHCPQKTKKIKVVTYAPWFDLEYSELRKLRRKAEKKYKKTGLQIHKQEFVELRKKTTNLAFNKKREYYNNKIDESGGNSKTLFACLNKLLDIKQETVCYLLIVPVKNLQTDSRHILMKKFVIFEKCFRLNLFRMM